MGGLFPSACFPASLLPCSLFPSHPPPCAFFSAPLIFGYPAVCSLSCPHPPDPRSQSALPGGKGENHSFLMQGASPLASPGAEPGRHWLFLWKAVPEGGLSPGLPAGSAVPVPEGGLPFASPAAPALSLLSCPHPPDPLPGGKGEFQSLFCRGLRPRHPCDRVGSGTGFTFGKRCRKGASPLASPGRDSQCRTGTSRIQNPQQKRLSRFCKTQNPSHHPIQQGNHRSGRQRKSSAK